jgi:hypothetical protein
MLHGHRERHNDDRVGGAVPQRPCWWRSATPTVLVAQCPPKTVHTTGLNLTHVTTTLTHLNRTLTNQPITKQVVHPWITRISTHTTRSCEFGDVHHITKTQEVASANSGQVRINSQQKTKHRDTKEKRREVRRGEARRRSREDRNGAARQRAHVLQRGWCQRVQEVGHA